MERKSCCSGRSYTCSSVVSTPKKEPVVSPKKEQVVRPKKEDVKPSVESIKKDLPGVGLHLPKDEKPEIVPVKQEEKVKVNAGCGGGGCGFK